MAPLKNGGYNWPKLPRLHLYEIHSIVTCAQWWVSSQIQYFHQTLKIKSSFKLLWQRMTIFTGPDIMQRSIFGISDYLSFAQITPQLLFFHLVHPLFVSDINNIVREKTSVIIDWG